jgi:hypothetical protein
MRLGTILGVVLLVIGAVVGLQGLKYTTHRSVLKVGDFEAKVEEDRVVPVWVGGVLVLAGLGLIAYSQGRRGGT